MSLNYLTILICLSIFTCKPPAYEEKIIGQWYSFDSFHPNYTIHDYYYSYTEVSISKDIIETEVFYVPNKYNSSYQIDGNKFIVDSVEYKIQLVNNNEIRFQSKKGELQLKRMSKEIQLLDSDLRIRSILEGLSKFESNELDEYFTMLNQPIK